MNRLLVAFAVAVAALGLGSPANAESVKVNGIDLHYDVQGSGEPLILIHGFLECSNLWAPVVPELARRYKVITVDLRGHGARPTPRTNSPTRNRPRTYAR